MEAKDMVAPEHLRRGILPIISPPRERSAPVLPKPAARPTPEAPLQPKKKERKRISAKTGLVLAGLAALGTVETTGAVITELKNDQPMSAQTIPADLAWPWNLGKSAVGDIQGFFKGRAPSETSTNTDVFNPQAKEGVIKPSMIERVPQEEIDKLDSLGKISNHNTVQVLFPIDTSTSNKPNSEIKYKKTYSGNGNEQDRTNRAEQGFLNVFHFDSVPAGSTIRAPENGRLIVYTWSGNPTPISDHDFTTATIDFLVNGEEYRLIISGGEKTRGPRGRGDVFKSLTNAPTIGYHMEPSEVLRIKEQKAIPTKKGEPILQVADEEINLTFFMRGNIDMNRVDKSQLKEVMIDGKKLTILMEDPINLELALSNGAIATPAQTKQIK